MSYKAGRFERRLKERQALRAQEEAPEPPREERRQEDRRVRSMTPAEVEDWLKRNGLSGEDRRKTQRRKR